MATDCEGAPRQTVYGVRCPDGVIGGQITTHHPNAEMRVRDADRGCVCGLASKHEIVTGSVTWTTANGEQEQTL